MSIKGKFGSDLFVGKTTLTLLYWDGRKTSADYELIKSATLNHYNNGSGVLLIQKNNGKKFSFKYRKNSSLKMERLMIKLKEKNSAMTINKIDSFHRILSFKSIVAVSLLSIGLSFSIFTLMSNKEPDPSVVPDEPVIIADNKQDIPNTQAYSTTLTAGHYTVGIDIPSGVYSFYAKSGFGNFMSDDNAINEIFDSDTIAGEMISNYTVDELIDVPLSDGTILTITGTLKVSAGCDEAGNTSPRNQNISEVELGYGMYAAGDDFQAGTYDIVWIEGFGNVITDPFEQSNGINEIFGAKQGDEGSISSELYKEIALDDYEIPSDITEIYDELNEILFITEFRNVEFHENDILKIEDVKVKLIPSS